MTATGLNALEVLLVDDDEEDYLLTQDLFRRLDGAHHEVHWANDYRSGIEAARTTHFDVCLVDYRLGADDGIEMVKELVEAHKDVPVIVLTGQGDRDVDLEAARAGAADYLVKGEVSPAILERTIRYAIRSNADLQALRESEENLLRLNDELESRVRARTAELERAVEELDREKESISRLANIHRAVLDSTIDGILMVGIDRKAEVTNTAFEFIANEVFEIPRITTLDALDAEVAALSTDPTSYLEATRRIAADDECAGLDEFELARSRRAFQRYTAPVRDARGTLIGRIFVLRDVTGEREAERMRSDLISTVAHELRTPLTSILGVTDLLAADEADPDKRGHYLEIVHSAGERLNHLLSDFLDLQRIEAGRFSMKLERCALTTFVEEEIALYSTRSSKHTIELQKPAEPIDVICECDRLRQVVGNLLSNAIKYSPEGGTITVKIEGVGDHAAVSVTDPGIGIDFADQAHVFDKFYRVGDPRMVGIEGTGLGLAICREIIQAHRGELVVNSPGRGQGTEFRFTLPRGFSV